MYIFGYEFTSNKMEVFEENLFGTDWFGCMGGILGFVFNNAIAFSVTGFLAWGIGRLNRCRCGKKIVSTAIEIEEERVSHIINLGEYW